jgi:fructose-1,6-bisphosphatase
MVGDVHRTLLYGGVFGYPGDTKVRRRSDASIWFKFLPVPF